MKLLLNIESLIPPLTGIGNYTLNLIEQLQDEDIEHIECFIGARSWPASQALANCAQASTQYAQNLNNPGAARESLKTQLRNTLRNWTLAYKAREMLRDMQLKLRARHRRDYVYHEPNFMLKAHSGPCVSTIHDLSFLHYPQFHPKKRVDWLSAQLPKTLKRADYLITDSNIIRDELIGDFGVSPDRVRTVYLGASEDYRVQDSEQTLSTLQRYKLQHGRYVLFVGTLEPRKGVDTLLDAWSSLPQALREEFPLVLAGAPGWQNQQLGERIKTLEATCGLRQLSFVPGADLPALYAGAATFAYPSLYEGFGLPVLEAMQCAVPVICTDDTSMSEFAQGSARLMERSNAEHLRQHLLELLSDPQARLQLAQSGLQRAADFSWKRCAQETLEIYRQVSPV